MQHMGRTHTSRAPGPTQCPRCVLHVRPCRALNPMYWVRLVPVALAIRPFMRPAGRRSPSCHGKRPRHVPMHAGPLHAKLTPHVCPGPHASTAPHTTGHAPPCSSPTTHRTALSDAPRPPHTSPTRSRHPKCSPPRPRPPGLHGTCPVPLHAPDTAPLAGHATRPQSCPKPVHRCRPAPMTSPGSQTMPHGPPGPLGTCPTLSMCPPTRFHVTQLRSTHPMPPRPSPPLH